MEVSAGTGSAIRTTELRTGVLPAAERFPAWLEMVARGAAPHQVQTPFAREFRATVRGVELGGLQATMKDLPPLVVRRTPRIIRSADPELFHLGIMMRGSFELTQERCSAVAGPREINCFFSSRPHRGLLRGGGDARSCRMVMASVPVAVLPFSPRQLGALVGRPLPGQRGIGSLMTRHLLDLIVRAPQYEEADARRLTSVTIDLIAGLLARELEGDCLPPDQRESVLLSCVEDFIRRHLADPALSPRMIANVHHISLRTLHRLFEARDTTVAACVRRLRLERCRQLLIDPAYGSSSVETIARLGGFVSLPHFNRLFRTTYGAAPASYRKQIGGPGAARIGK